jgi:hypothetical protein
MLNTLVDCDPRLAEGSASLVLRFLVRRVLIHGLSTMTPTAARGSLCASCDHVVTMSGGRQHDGGET